MIKHLFKIVWNRKRTNFLIIVEIFFSFLVLFSVTVFAVYYTDNYRQPLGFSYDNVWNISVERDRGRDRPQISDTEEAKAPLAPEGPDPIISQLFSALRDINEIESTAGANTAPYSHSTSSSGYELNGALVIYQVNRVTDSFKDLMGLTLVEGRWFGKEDAGANFNPVVINQRLSREIFGNESPIGKKISPDTEPDGQPRAREDRVIGVITDFRKDGEYSGLGNYVFERNDIESSKGDVPDNILVKVRPGTSAELQEKINNRLQAVAKDWSFEIEPLSDMRESFLRLYVAPIIAGGTVAAFLLIMVALGLTGVLWQNVTQRIREIGLRRAKGATAGNIYTQILGELVIIASFGLIVGVLVVVQFPLLDLIGFISKEVYTFSLVISLVMIYLLTVVCGLYPSRLATRIRPADALHYE
ncbi:MAG TPA: ABC transporter permease [Blastocatellia bacterium]|jgi:putative ABC transport system permease protein|nr:ABC transporter permease [Blastocatellia bacterium]